MKRFIDLALSILVLYPGRFVAREKFRAASGVFSTTIHAVLWATYEKKLFQKYGLDGE
ncbi:MAG TPA: hypothetical protein VJ646_09845 [Candidatus Binatia bacterium]|nr:hypothetical protein [Candidatus Binatia bacterium]